MAEGPREGVGGQAEGGRAAVPVPHEQRVLLRKEQREHQAQQQRRVEVLSESAMKRACRRGGRGPEGGTEAGGCTLL